MSDIAAIQVRRASELAADAADYLEGLMEGFCAYDAGWRMTYMNAAAERILGRTRADVLGKTWHQAFPHAVGNPVDEMYQRVMRQRVPERMEFYYAHYGRWLEISASPARTGGVGVYFRDATERNRAEQALRDEARLLDTLNRVGRALAAELDLERVVQAVTDAATELSGAAFGAFSYSIRNERGETYAPYSAGDEARAAFAGFALPSSMVRLADIADAPLLQPAPSKGEGRVRSFLATPVVSRAGEVLGALFFGHPDRDVFTERSERLVAGIAAQAAIAMDNARLYKALQRSERDLSDFFENGAVGLHWVGPDGTILRANRAELELLGYSREEYVGRNIAEFHADRETIDDILTCLSAGHTLANREARLRCKDGSVKEVLISSNVLWEDNRFIHTRCFTRDITELKQAERALVQADQRKDQFLATLAHELRNPLAPIRNGLQLLRLVDRSSDSAEQVRAMMERQTAHLIRLVDDLLEISRISRGSIELRKDRVELAEVIASAAETSRPLVEAGRHALRLQMPAEAILLQGDAVRLAQVISNLLNNAAKYTDDGGEILLSVRRERDLVVISVRDNGVGIEPHMLPRVFEMFTRAHPALQRAQGGLGIGLALARTLVELHGGQIEALSDGPGRGSEFTVRLPLMEATPAQPLAQQGAWPGTQGAPARRVLVVDDNVDAALTLSLLLQQLGHCVTTLHDGAAALDHLQHARPEIVLLDLSMPGMDGIEVARRIRRQGSGREVRLVAITGLGQAEDRRRALEAGFDRHLVKPISAEELEGALRL